ncbi:GNAT family N-acetyltransferase [Bifidobacterium magnum]|uniref:Acetyltransferase, GNAT family n=1 Tax=Bifidobacterium magnum TaxID=1692 RepID=A0A087BCU3_9BIFI|nr:GNAT family N-acetyltransferase [Bifidobacterium magnum]KFI68843.1 Acetyltransferase, GNAT family [Bifidobacterium magnum]
MTETVTYRTMTRDDYSALINMVCNAWYNDNECDWATAHRAAEIDFEYALARTTTAQVAVVAGRVVGVILGRIDSLETRPAVNKHHTNTLKLMAGLVTSQEGRVLAHRLKEMKRANEAMLKAAKREGHAYDAEVVLFMVDPDVQGQGIGAHLFDWLLDQFKANGVKNYFLMTDTTSDYSFYDHKGMNRVQQEPMTPFPMPQPLSEDERIEEHLHAFMYDSEVDASNEGVNPLGRD